MDIVEELKACQADNNIPSSVQLETDRLYFCLALSDMSKNTIFYCGGGRLLITHWL